MPWKAFFNGGDVRPDGSVSLGVHYAQTLAGGAPGQSFDEVLEFGPTDPISKVIVKTKAMARVAILDGREPVIGAIETFKGEDISTW